MTDVNAVSKRAGDLDPRIYRQIWKHVGKKNVREIADKTGLSVAEVLRIKNEMIENVDVLTVDQKRTQLIVDLMEVADRAREMAESARDERALSGLLTSSIQAMKTVLAELRQIEKTGTSEVEALNALRQREIVTVYEDAGQPFLEWLVEEHGVPEEVATAKYQELLLSAARQMDERHQ